MMKKLRFDKRQTFEVDYILVIEISLKYTNDMLRIYFRKIQKIKIFLMKKWNSKDITDKNTSIYSYWILLQSIVQSFISYYICW